MSKSRTVAVYAMLIAMTVVFTFIPVQFGLSKLAVLMLFPVMIAGQLEGFKAGTVLGLALGLCSMTTSWIMPQSVISYCFRNPLVSVFPRVLVGMTSNLAYRGALRLIAGKKTPTAGKKYLASTLGAITTVVVNTATVLTMIWLLYGGKPVEGTVITGVMVMALVSINFVVEVIVCPLITPPVVKGLQKALGK